MASGLFGNHPPLVTRPRRETFPPAALFFHARIGFSFGELSPNPRPITSVWYGAAVRLVLPIPEACPRRELDADRTLVVLEGPEDRPLITLVLHHPRIVEESLLEFATDIARTDLPQGGTAHVLGSRVDTNRVGWPFQVIQGVVTAAGGSEIEARLTAVYRFTPYRTFPAAAVARVHDPKRFAELRPRIEAMFEEGRPDWSGDLASLAQIYD